ncbi:telomere-protecting terminal protein Tpg [Streptomyces sp. NPDC051567]|uniref:telomere-protecting terminal protein Tpg n=1 Tax=Streptomyces sp. NPDC051567 TaxID=3365660 RepID=UPI0037943E0C
MGILGDSLERAAQITRTRPVPRSAGARMRHLVEQTKSTKTAAALRGISQRTVERYVRDPIRTPRPEHVARLEAEVRRRWQPLVRKRAREKATTQTGLVMETRDRFGFTAAPGPVEADVDRSGPMAVLFSVPGPRVGEGGGRVACPGHSGSVGRVTGMARTGTRRACVTVAP